MISELKNYLTNHYKSWNCRVKRTAVVKFLSWYPTLLAIESFHDPTPRTVFVIRRLAEFSYCANPQPGTTPRTIQRIILTQQVVESYKEYKTFSNSNNPWIEFCERALLQLLTWLPSSFLLVLLPRCLQPVDLATGEELL